MQLEAGVEGTLHVFGCRVSCHGNGRDSSQFGVEGSDAPNELVAILRRHPEVGHVSQLRERLIAAYAQGIFPWFGEDDPLLWWSPDPRMVLFTGEVRVARSLRRVLRARRFQLTMDTAFADVNAARKDSIHNRGSACIREEASRRSAPDL